MKRCLFIISIVLISSLSCNKDENEEYRCDANSSNRIGAMCQDGTRSNSVSSGTCSGHGGVDYWICK